MKNKFNKITLFTFLIALFWYGCQEKEIAPFTDSFKIQQYLSSTSEVSTSALSCQETVVADLYAGAGKNDLSKGEDVGDVFLYSEDGLVKVKYVIDEESDWCLTEAHLWIGHSASEIEGAEPGQFPYKKEFEDPYPKSYTFEIEPLDLGLDEGEVCGAGLVLATHAVVAKVVTPTPYYASSVVSDEQGLNKDGSEVLSERSVPEQGLEYETDRDPTNFFSLGFGGNIVVEFDCPIVNGEGNDVRVIEDTWGTYPLEKAEVYASNDNENWTLLGVADNKTRDDVFNIHTVAEFDLGELTEAKYIKVVDISDPEVFNQSNADGYDLNAVESLQNCTVDETAWGFNACTTAFIDLEISKKWGGVFCAEICCFCIEDAQLLATQNFGDGYAPVAGTTEMPVRIYSITTAGVADLISDIPAPVNGTNTGNFNANAYDPVNQRFYFTVFGKYRTADQAYDSPLYFNDLLGNQVYAGDLTGNAASGTFYNSEYYYFADRTDDYYKVKFNSDGTIASITKMEDVLGNTGGFDVKTYFGFGDITVDPSDGTVYGSATKVDGGNIFFKMNLDGSGFEIIATGGIYGAGSIQIAFGADGVLYGVNARTPFQLYSINPATGASSQIATMPVPFSDLAAGPACP